MKLVAVVLSKSEEVSKKTLESLRFAKEVYVVVDTEVNKKPYRSGNINFLFRPLKGNFSEQRNYVLNMIKDNWVLFVDDDEVVSNELILEISEITKDTHFSGFFIPRVDVVYHDPLLHGEVGSIKLLRLGLPKSGKFKRSVHEYWNIKNNIGTLNSPLYHIKDHFVSEFLPRIIKYCQIDSKILFSEGKDFSVFRLFANPLGKFIQNYIFRLGLLDGYPGLFQAYLMSLQSLSVRIYQWETK